MAARLQASASDALLRTLKERFEKHPERHRGLNWPEVEQRLLSKPEKLVILQAMESTGGEPDVIGYVAESDEYLFCDCSPETPAGRRSLCYDLEAWKARKENKPAGDAMSMAEEMGICMLTESEYFQLQQLGEFDLKTSSWLATPADVRKRGGALFGDRRYGRVFIYHNGVQSYYAARGFRGMLHV